MKKNLSVDEKIELIKRNCFEIVNEDKIKDFMKKGIVNISMTIIAVLV